MTAEQRVAELGLDLTPTAAPVANYVMAVQTGNLVFLSGQLPILPDGSRQRGKVGVDLTPDDAYLSARLATVALLSRLKEAVGSLDRVTRIVKVNGYVNALPDFDQQSQVINGASDLLVEVFGDAGRHARAAIGVGSLPLGAPVEVEMIVEVAA